MARGLEKTAGGQQRTSFRSGLALWCTPHLQAPDKTCFLPWTLVSACQRPREGQLLARPSRKVLLLRSLQGLDLVPERCLNPFSCPETLCGLALVQTLLREALGGGRRSQKRPHTPHPHSARCPGGPPPAPPALPPCPRWLDTALVRLTGRLRPHDVHARPARWHRPCEDLTQASTTETLQGRKALSAVPGFQRKPGGRAAAVGHAHLSLGAPSWTVL